MVTIEYHKIRREIFENPIFNIQLKSMRIVGYIIGDNQRYQLLHYMRFVIVVLSFVAATCLTFIKVWRGIDKLDADGISRGSALHFVSVTVMCINAFFQRKRVVAIVNFIHDDLLILRSCADDVEERLFRKTVKYLHTLTCMLWLPTLFSGLFAIVEICIRVIFWPETIFNVPQILNGTAQPILMFKIVPFGEVYDNFLVGVFAPCYMIFLNINTLPMWNTFITCLMMYVIFKVKIVSKRLQEMDFTKINSNLKSKDDIAELTEMEQNYWYLKMCEYCVEEQIKIRWFVHELELLIRIPVFNDFMIFSMLICFFLYAMATGNIQKGDYILTLEFMEGVLVYIWLYNWHGTLVTESYNAMSFAIYSCNWYEYPLQLQKTIRLLMTECSNALVIRAIFLELKVGTFVDIVRCAFSYFNILRNLHFK